MVNVIQIINKYSFWYIVSLFYQFSLFYTERGMLIFLPIKMDLSLYLFLLILALYTLKLYLPVELTLLSLWNSLYIALITFYFVFLSSLKLLSFRMFSSFIPNAFTHSWLLQVCHFAVYFPFASFVLCILDLQSTFKVVFFTTYKTMQEPYISTPLFVLSYFTYTYI